MPFGWCIIFLWGTGRNFDHINGLGKDDKFFEWIIFRKGEEKECSIYLIYVIEGRGEGQEACQMVLKATHNLTCSYPIALHNSPVHMIHREVSPPPPWSTQ